MEGCKGAKRGSRLVWDTIAMILGSSINLYAAARLSGHRSGVTFVASAWSTQLADPVARSQADRHETRHHVRA